MRKTIFLTVWSLSVKPSGMNRSIFKQAQQFLKHGYNPVILTMDFSLDYRQIERELKAYGFIPDDVPVLNVYDYYREKFNEQSMSSVQKAYYENSIKKFEEGYWVEDDGDTARYFVNGVYTKYKRWDKNGQLMIVDEFDDNRVRISRREFHPEGFLARETLYHPANNKRNQERYFTRSGFCYLTIWYNNETDRQQSAFLFDPAYSKAMVFPAVKQLQTKWIHELVKLEAVKPIIIAEQPSTVDRVSNIEGDEASRIYMRHTSHVESFEPLVMAKDADMLLRVMPKGYPIVVTTHAQRRHLEQHIGDRENIFVMPDYFESTAVDVARDMKKFVSVSSYDASHCTSELIEAFAQVVEKEPAATLELYGKLTKARKDAMNKQIAKLNLKDAVKVHGYKLNIDEVLASGVANVIVSQTDGQASSIGEAFANGTPVIAYDVAFGAAEAIKDGQAGFLVEAHNVDALAQAMMAMFDEEKAKEMGVIAKKEAEARYTAETYSKNWLALLDHIEEHMPREPLI